MAAALLVCDFRAARECGFNGKNTYKTKKRPFTVKFSITGERFRTRTRRDTFGMTQRGKFNAAICQVVERR